MNNFTKEELECIYDAVLDTYFTMPKHLPAKIESLIDNYCPHDMGRIEDSALVEICDGCGEYL